MTGVTMGADMLRYKMGAKALVAAAIAVELRPDDAETEEPASAAVAVALIAATWNVTEKSSSSKADSNWYLIEIIVRASNNKLQQQYTTSTKCKANAK